MRQIVTRAVDHGTGDLGDRVSRPSKVSNVRNELSARLVVEVDGERLIRRVEGRWSHKNGVGGFGDSPLPTDLFKPELETLR